MEHSFLLNNEKTSGEKETTNLSATLTRLKLYEDIVENALIFQESIDALKALPFTHIRCLALGSPTESIPSLYQLAYLNQICCHLKMDKKLVSLYDPIFTDVDIQLLTKNIPYLVSEKTNSSSEMTLYFLPHATLELTEQVLAELRPRWLLGNDITAHSIRFPRLRLHEKYRTVSLLANLLEKNSGNEENKKGKDDGFKEQTTKSRRRKQRHQHRLPEINFDYSNCYFSDASIKTLTDTDGPWGNAFSSLSLHWLR